MNNKFLIVDFDSTFVQVETLDELAAIALAEHPESERVIEKIRTITAQGMDGKISLAESLDERLKLLSANKKHIEQLVSSLADKVSPSFKRNGVFLEQFADSIYIVSSGFKEYILPIVSKFGIKEDHVFANTFTYDEAGNINGLDASNPLCQDQGKVRVVNSLNLEGSVWAVGDGITDYEIRAAGAADIFYAFTENVERASVTAKADVVIKNFDEFLYMHDFPRAISYPRNRIKILLLENLHPNGIKMLEHEGYTVETLKGSLSEDELCAKIKDVTILGIRSKTTVTKKVLDAAERLISIGCFCIGTNQVDLDYATQKGVCVFNAPFSNTRSVVEMVIGEIIMLMRKVVSKNAQLHQGKWDKSADNCFELRGKKLGIVGYGNIGSQLSVLAEAMGMQVYYYDVMEKLQLGNARKCDTMDELLSSVDIVTLHVDGRKSNAKIIGEHEFKMMKDNVIFINLSRGHVVDIDAMVKVLDSGKILGAAVDVFPVEPKNNQEEFVSALRGYDNVILSPHIGGSTEEAQLNIGEFVARRLTSYVNGGDSTQSVNLPNIQLPNLRKAHRLIHLHRNVPGVLAQINQMLASHQANILGQYLKTNEQVGYVISDIDVEYDKDLINQLKKIDGTIKSRVLY
ncbi:MAG: phosphoglycerate dehydrogenase [Burkholderiales bacterium]|nr:phosphoglycerate dehydrogenase [Burkholderiales bacterium]MBP9768896.1 phosphoglycerate dehydrogenase [Burkholderiales bacterium]